MRKNNLCIKNGMIHTMNRSSDIVEGDLLIENGKIQKVGENLDCAEDFEVIDARGGIVMPGIIDAHNHIGIFESGIGDAGVDGNEDTDPITPQLRAIDGIYPLDPEFRYSYENGVTCVATGPGSSNPIAGQFVALKTKGRVVDDMILQAPLAMKAAFGENPKNSHGSKGRSPITRMGTAAVIREWLYKAKDYVETKEKKFDMRLEALAPVIKGKLPLKAHAHRADDIMTALRIAEEFDLQITLDHCSEGHLIADVLAYTRQKGVILGPFLGFPHKNEVIHQCVESAAILYDAGVKIAIMTDLPAMHTSNLRICAGMCYRAGLPLEEAMKAITSNAAEILGLEDRIGTIESGKDADIAIFDKNPVEHLTAECMGTVIDGELVYLAKNQKSYI